MSTVLAGSKASKLLHPGCSPHARYEGLVYLTIRCSKEATWLEKSWDDNTYESLGWRHYGELFKHLSNGQEQIQISKYTNDLLPTKQRLATNS
jgi:hypothetical protein